MWVVIRIDSFIRLYFTAGTEALGILQECSHYEDIGKEY